mmetsp:Transcript_2951/g.4371  ORF Transcript_2951/g.4371 Transcript_2951/m.4371 type:complete len:300 (-) Transcript_2951:41-940(-)
MKDEILDKRLYIHWKEVEQRMLNYMLNLFGVVIYGNDIQWLSLTVVVLRFRFAPVFIFVVTNRCIRSHLDRFYQTLLDRIHCKLPLRNIVHDRSLLPLTHLEPLRRTLSSHPLPRRCPSSHPLLFLELAFAHPLQDAEQRPAHVRNVLEQPRLAFLHVAQCIPFCQVCAQLLAATLQGALHAELDFGDVVPDVFLSGTLEWHLRGHDRHEDADSVLLVVDLVRGPLDFTVRDSRGHVGASLEKEGNAVGESYDGDSLLGIFPSQGYGRLDDEGMAVVGTRLVSCRGDDFWLDDLLYAEI